MDLDKNSIRKALDRSIKQDGYDIFAKEPLTVNILLDIVGKDDIQIEEGYILTDIALSLILSDYEIPFAISGKTKIYYDSNWEEPSELPKNGVLSFTFLVGQKIMTLVPETDDIKGTLKKVTGIFYNSGKQVKNIENVPITLGAIPAYSGLDSLHLEVLASQMIREPGNEYIPWRINQKGEPVVVGLKEVAFLEHELVGLAFENAGKAITKGLVAGDRELTGNIIEKEILLDF